jgi:hypothetical protein
MLFWPVVIALGPGFAALYYDHDVRSFPDRGVCEQTLAGLEQRAKQEKEFMTALTEAAGEALPGVVFQRTCIDKTPQEFQRDLQDQADDATRS